eukprot:1153835-Pelagomonas_calceolata.AAC.7
MNLVGRQGCITVSAFKDCRGKGPQHETLADRLLESIDLGISYDVKVAKKGIESVFGSQAKRGFISFWTSYAYNGTKPSARKFGCSRFTMEFSLQPVSLAAQPIE